ncbi:MAG: hypothetical protein WAU33_05975 [Candidatus Binataceae bacterium]
MAFTQLAGECIDASGFLPSVEMTDVGLVNGYRGLSQAHNRHFEPWARNPEAYMLQSTPHAAALVRDSSRAAATHAGMTPSTSRVIDIKASYYGEVGSVMKQADWHIYQVLTKRHERMKELLGDRLSWLGRLGRAIFPEQGAGRSPVQMDARGRREIALRSVRRSNAYIRD